MRSRKNNELTIVVPGLGKEEAKKLRESLKEVKKTYAPHAKASIQIGREENFVRLMDQCRKQLGKKEE